MDPRCADPELLPPLRQPERPADDAAQLWGWQHEYLVRVPRLSAHVERPEAAPSDVVSRQREFAAII